MLGLWLRGCWIGVADDVEVFVVVELLLALVLVSQLSPIVEGAE